MDDEDYALNDIGHVHVSTAAPDENFLANFFFSRALIYCNHACKNFKTLSKIACERYGYFGWKNSLAILFKTFYFVIS